MPTAPTTTGRRSRSCSALSAGDVQASTHPSWHRPYRGRSEPDHQSASRGPALRWDGSRSRLGHRGRSGAREALRSRNRQDNVGGAVRLAGVRGEAPEIGTIGVRGLRPQRGGVDLARGAHPRDGPDRCRLRLPTHLPLARRTADMGGDHAEVGRSKDLASRRESGASHRPGSIPAGKSLPSSGRIRIARSAAGRPSNPGRKS
jgi:hypothetical protein